MCGAQSAASGGSRRFLLPIGECEFAISSILDDLQRDADREKHALDKRTLEMKPEWCENHQAEKVGHVAGGTEPGAFVLWIGSGVYEFVVG